MRAAARRTLHRFGRRGRSVRVFVERGGDLVRAQWRVRGALRTRSWPDTPVGRAEARAFAEALAAELAGGGRPREPLTVRELWRRYLEAEARALRPATIRNRQADWRRWELFVGREALAEEIGPDRLAELVAALDRQGLAVRTVGEVVRTVKLVYHWGEEHELLARDRLARYRYRIPRDRRPESPDEFTRDEFARVLAALDPESRNGWRAWGVLALCGYQGVRQWAVLHLRWEDWDRERGRLIWCARWDKMGREWEQPVREPTRHVLERLRRWHEELGLASPWVFPAHHRRARGEVYTRAALWHALRRAEQRAGIAHRPGRGAHGLRRMLAGDVMAVSGNPRLAGEAIGDTDLKSIERYLKRREGELAEVFRLLDRATATQTVTEGRGGDTPPPAAGG